MPTWIADQAVVFVHADGRRLEGRIAIGTPYYDERNAACAYSLDGLDPPRDRVREIFGETTLQALLLTVQFVGTYLHGFVAHGGRVLHVDGSELPLEALFGPLLRAPA